ncbi:MAG: arylsulfatase [Planctomycetota bacterium]
MRLLPCLLPLLLTACATAPVAPESRTNVIVVITDDQGFGDFGFQGNPVLRTPNFDAMAERSARMESFYVSPVCAPTRASLMTGRWCQRTGAIDTFIGRAMMRPDEVTVAEMLRDAGWATGIFGKWHLGDCYPMRAIDQGFDHALVHLGGGIGQPSDPEGGEGRYTDAVLFRNGERVETEGYCTDVYFDEALSWIGEQHAEDRPFFAYVATNAPHSPFHDVPEELLEEYRTLDLAPTSFPDLGHPLPDELQADKLARVFAMIENIDQNVGRLFAELERLGALEDTLVLFLNDNGPNTRRYARGLRGMKCEVYEGGVRSPLLAHWPGRLRAGAASDRVSAHVDVLPTILDACGVAPPSGVELDGRSLLPLLAGGEPDWPDRALVVQAHRGYAPVRYHNALIRTQRWKLVNASGFHRDVPAVEPAFELYDVLADPYEAQDLAASRPEVVAELRAVYERWFDDVGASDPSNYRPTPIGIGSPRAPLVTLTRQDWRREAREDGSKPPAGHWVVDVERAGAYDVRVRLLDGVDAERITLRFAGGEWSGAPSMGAREYTFLGVPLPAASGPLEVLVDSHGEQQGAYQVELLPAP